jgi:hypothetical protein
MAREIASICRNVQAQNFAGLALCHHLKRPAADFAIGRKSLNPDAGIHHNFE